MSDLHTLVILERSNCGNRFPLAVHLEILTSIRRDGPQGSGEAKRMSSSAGVSLSSWAALEPCSSVSSSAEGTEQAT
jgi:prophage antirepressor-like protein